MNWVRNSVMSDSSGNSSPGLIQQTIFAFVLIVIIYLSFSFVEMVYKYINRLSISRVELLPNTYNIEDKSITISQDPSVNGSKVVHLSDNEIGGIEFTYSFYLNIHPSAFKQEAGLLHIFHKGYSSQFPLLAPGVYMRSDKNTMRIYMNTYRTCNNYIEIECHYFFVFL